MIAGNKIRFLQAIVLTGLLKSFRSKYFVIEGERLQYCGSCYNWTWQNERSVEVPVVLHLLGEGANPSDMLEVGNVLSHYGVIGQDVVDLYEKAEGVLNVDIVSFSPPRKYDCVVSISTLEHVGWDEEGHDPDKALLALDKMFQLLKPGGKMIITVPLGYNPAIDKMVSDGAPRFDRQIFMKRVSPGSWVQAGREQDLGNKYDVDSRSARIVFFGVAAIDPK